MCWSGVGGLVDSWKVGERRLTQNLLPTLSSSVLHDRNSENISSTNWDRKKRPFSHHFRPSSNLTGGIEQNTDQPQRHGICSRLLKNW